ncbi:MAG: hypothetical protein ACTS3F_07435 [Phycisphaerales bacterium]
MISHRTKSAIVWSASLLIAGGAFIYLYGSFVSATPAHMVPSARLWIIIPSLIISALIGWFVGILLTGLGSVFIPRSRPNAPALIKIDAGDSQRETAGDGPASPAGPTPHQYTLARCPNCGYERAGLAADAPCPECAEPAPRIHTLPGPGNAKALHAICPRCGRAQRRGAKTCPACHLKLRQKRSARP